jgi:hypothetical protein
LTSSSSSSFQNTDKNNEFISDGYHIFPFEFILPSNGLVTSFEGKYGSIRYYLKAEIDKPWAFNHRVKKLFTLITPVDINESDYLIPINNQAYKTICCWCCASGPISLIIRSDRRGYCPGESILLTAHFQNTANRTIIPKATLFQLQKYKASNDHEWNSKFLKIPPISPSIKSDIIKVEYYVKVCLIIPASYNLSCCFRITIGTVPFNNNNNENAVLEMISNHQPFNDG